MTLAAALNRDRGG